MSKKDRRAIEAHGLRPSGPDRDVMRDLLSRVIADSGPTYTWSTVPGSNMGNVWLDLRTQQVKVQAVNGYLTFPSASITIDVD